MLPPPDVESSGGLAHICLATVAAGNPVDHTLLLVRRNWVLGVHQDIPECPMGLETRTDL